MAIAQINERLLRNCLLQEVGPNSRWEFAEIWGFITFVVYGKNGMMLEKAAYLIEHDPTTSATHPQHVWACLSFYVVPGNEPKNFEDAFRSFGQRAKVFQGPIINAKLGIPEDYQGLGGSVGTPAQQRQEDPRIKQLYDENYKLASQNMDLRQAYAAAYDGFMKYARHNMRCSTGTTCDCLFDQTNELIILIDGNIRGNLVPAPTCPSGVTIC